MEQQKQKKLNWFTRKTTSQKISFIFSVLFFVISIGILILSMNLRPIIGDELADDIYGKDVENGFVALGKLIAGSSMSVISTIVVIAVSFVIIFLTNFFTRLFTGKGRKGKTIAALIRSLVKYIVIIAALCIAMAFWGVNVASIVAGVGIVTLIVGLGCQTLIQDVIAGLFIVFDDYFAVGDICIIDGFRGTIVDIGLKSTKIKDAGGNIKSINNSSINTVVDLSREDSMVTVTVPVGYNEDPLRVEAILIKELPLIKAKLPQVTSDIQYKGISALGDSEIDYLLLCFCKEADRFQVTRDLNREILLLLERNNLQIVFPQIVVNQPDDPNRKKATKEEIMTAEEAVAKLRELPKEETESRFSFFHKAVESFDQTAKESLEGSSLNRK